VAGPVQTSGPRAPGKSRLANVPGVTDTTVKLGVEYISTEDLQAFQQVAGVKAVGATDMLKAYQAVVAAVNKAGGVAGGRKLVIVPRKRETTESVAQAGQTTCAAFTDDDRVFAANLYHNQDSPGVPCLTSRGVLAIGGGAVEGGSQRDFQRFGGRYLSSGTVDTVSAARTYVDALVRQGFLTKSSKVGLLWFDFADFQEARARGLKPAVAANGLNLVSEYRVTYSEPSDLGRIASSMQNAVLTFRNAGVDRVITLDYQGTLTYFFMTTAQSQGYHPRHGLASWSDAEFLRANGNGDQLAGSMGVGWMPAYDLQVRQQPGNAATAECRAIMKAAQMPAWDAQGDVILQLRACAEVLFLAKVLNTTTDLGFAAIGRAAASLGERPSYVGFSERFAVDKLWGGAAYRDLAWGVSCSCFTYRGATRRF
jgi:ABC-type branched-subunit amino acid transport system substrate-binding protein